MLHQERPPCSPHLLGWSFINNPRKEEHYEYEYILS